MNGRRNVTLGCLFVLSTFASADGQTTAPVADESQTQLAQKYINEKLAIWQQRLKLTDWHISVSQVHRTDLKPRTMGGISWDKSKKSAVIRVLDPSDYQLAFSAALDDMELTIVHELVHLELASLPRKEASRSVEEHAVNGIADALLALDRRQQ